MLQNRDLKPSFRPLGTLWDRLTAPAASIEEPGQRRQAQLLATLLVVFVPLITLLAAASGLFPPSRPVLRNPEFLLALGLDLLLIVAYGLNRAGRHPLAAALTVGVFSVAVFAATIVGLAGAYPNYRADDPHLLVYLLLPTLFGSVFLALGGVCCLIALNIAGMLLLLLFFHQVTLPHIVLGPLTFYVMAVTVVLLVTYHRNQVERDRQARLRESEEHYRTLFHTARDAILVMRHDRIIDCNRASEEMFGCSRHDIMGRSPQEFSPPSQPDGRDSREKALAKIGAALAGDPQSFEWVACRLDGTPFYAEVGLNRMHISEEWITLSIVRDITERKRVENELREKEAREALILDSLPMAFYIAQPFGEFGGTWVSAQIDRVSGFTKEQFLAEPGLWAARLHPDDRARALDAFERLSAEDAIQVEYRWQAADGRYVWFLDLAVLVRDESGEPLEIVGTWLDITERKQMEEQIRASLGEKELLLQEIHHRVKNNLQIISALLSFQAQTLPQEQARAAFLESQNRIQSMARIHEHLYQSPDLAQVDMANYARGLLAYLQESYGAYAITPRIDTAGVVLDLDTGIPCGLIINELVSNSLKHAFPPAEERAGEVYVTMRREGDMLELVVGDDGVGLPADLDWREPVSLGLRLVHLLVRQLQGSLELDTGGGTAFRLRFRAPHIEPAR